MNRQDLENFKNNTNFIDDKLEYIKRQKASLYKTTQILSDMPTGSRKVEDSMAEKLAKLLDSLDELLDYLNKLQEKQKEIQKIIWSIEYPYRDLLDKFYIEGKTLVRVADEMNYSYQGIKKVKKNALNRFDEECTKVACKIPPKVL